MAKDYSGLEINDPEIKLIESKFHPKTLRKRQYLLKAGKLSKYTAFITKGAMRQYCVDDKGNEKIVQLYIENYWVDDRASLTATEPSEYNIQAWEDTEMLIITPQRFPQHCIASYLGITKETLSRLRRQTLY
ncbi:Crp/Fnr family transcriptional regulator [Foetidibacter luteolus]|uniref:Crp/Fnr family transcriptional regulator n=1 Tax=Foetidibacter luteolus TaxID=2608880 RepID=UPI00129B70CF|nr:cyclic nucleotide-binding domain-containing protein [Foetidibacter luteolus]